MIEEVGKLWPLGQFYPADCFCKACELRIVFTILKDYKIKSKKNMSQRSYVT